MRTLAIRTALFATVFVLVPGMAHAQNADPERVAQLEAQLTLQEAELAKQQAALAKLRAQVEALRSPAILLLATEPENSKNPQSSPASSSVENKKPICTMRGYSDLNNALWGRDFNGVLGKPGKKYWPELNDCERADSEALASSDQSKEEGSKVPGRPGVATGFSSSLELGKEGKASVTYAHPIVWRLVGEDTFDGYTPQLARAKIALSTPLDSITGTGPLLDGRERKRFRDLNVLTGTSLTLGLDFMQFRRRDTEKARSNVMKILFEAYGLCMDNLKNDKKLVESKFFKLYDELPEPVDPAMLPDRCRGEQLIKFITETKKDLTVVGGVAFERPDLATRYQQSFWTAPKTEVPVWGWGASAEFSWPDFSYRQAAYTAGLTDGIAKNAMGKKFVSFDFLQPIPAPDAAASVGKLNYAIDGYVMRFFEMDNEIDGKSPTPPRSYDVPGIGVWLTARQSREWAFRPGTNGVTICSAAAPTLPVAGQTNVASGCSAVNLDAPYQRSMTSLGLELRGQMENIPFIRKFGLAPKFTYRLQDDRKQFDLPMFFSLDKDGKLSAGVRLSHQTGGEDLVGNPDDDATSLSVFFTALNFRAF